MVIRAQEKGRPGYRVEIAGREAFIDKVIRHPKGEIGEDGNIPESPEFTDVALLRLAAPISDIKPVALYDRKNEIGKSVLIPGWGGWGDGERALQKEDGRFRVATNRVDAVKGNYVEWKFDDPRAGRRAVALEGISGPGDSGGPALVRTRNGGWATLGVSSHQETFGGREGRYGVVERYTRISTLVPWITSEMLKNKR
jgi:hypothetical protein